MSAPPGLASQLLANVLPKLTLKKSNIKPAAVIKEAKPMKPFNLSFDFDYPRPLFSKIHSLTINFPLDYPE